MRLKIKFLYILVALAFLCTLLFLLLIGINAWVQKSTDTYIYSETSKIPATKTAVVLGTSKYVASGNINQYYKNRIEAAIQLYKAGKVQYIIVSGDNHKKLYNEPDLMKRDLVDAGIPADHVYLDFAGFRTFDSVVRCKKVFGQDSVIFVSQRFHNERALFIAQRQGLIAYAYNAQDVTRAYGFKTEMREYVARFKAVIDLYLLHTKPKFLGPSVRIP